MHEKQRTGFQIVELFCSEIPLTELSKYDARIVEREGLSIAPTF